MGEVANDLPDLERLMRNVLRMAMESERGSDWIGTLSRAQQESIARAAERAERKRPADPIRDGWDAVGFSEIGSLLRSEWPTAISAVWTGSDEAAVDFKRLVAYRDRNLHQVGAPLGEITDVEAAEIIRRLRVRFEAVRRDLQEDAGDWWPYIASTHSNIPEFCYERSASPSLPNVATLNEGDRVVIEAVGVHPTAGDNNLRYRLTSFRVPILYSHPWVTHSRFEFEVPRVRGAEITLGVTDVAASYGAAFWADDPTDEVVFRMLIRPARR